MRKLCDPPRRRRRWRSALVGVGPGGGEDHQAGHARRQGQRQGHQGHQREDVREPRARGRRLLLRADVREGAAGREGHASRSRTRATATHTFTSDGLNIDQQVSPGQVDEVHRHRPEQRHRVRVPLRLPREHGHAGRVLHQGRRHRAVRRRRRLLTPEAVSEEAPLRTRVGVVVVGDVAHVVVDVVLDGERLPGHSAQFGRACASRWSAGGSVPWKRHTTIGT